MVQKTHNWWLAWRQLPLEQKLCLLLAASLPFDRIPTLEFKGFTLKLSTVLGAALILRLLFHRPPPMRRKRDMLPFGVLMVWLGWVEISLLQVHVWRSAEQLVVPLSFLALLAVSVAFAVRNLPVRWLLHAIWLGALVSCLFGLFQFFGNWAGLPNWLTGIRPEYGWDRFGFPRLHSVALEPLYFSAYLLLPISLLLSAMVRSARYRSRGYFALLGLFILCDTLTVSRGGLLALMILVTVIFAAAFRKRQWRQFLKVALAGSAALVASAMLAVLVIGLVARQGQDSDLTYGRKGVSTLFAHFRDSRFFARGDNRARDDSVNQRDLAFHQALDVLHDSPSVLVLGVGPGQYDAYIHANRPPPYHPLPTNMPLEIILQFGLIGLLILAGLLSLLTANCWRLLRRTQNEAGIGPHAWLGYVVAITVQSLLFPGLTITHIWFMVGYGISLLLSKNPKN